MVVVFSLPEYRNFSWQIFQQVERTWASTIIAMTSMYEVSQHVLKHETKFPVTVQQKFRNEYWWNLPDVMYIVGWLGKFNAGIKVCGNKTPCCLFDVHRIFLPVIELSLKLKSDWNLLLENMHVMHQQQEYFYRN